MLKVHNLGGNDMKALYFPQLNNLLNNECLDSSCIVKKKTRKIIDFFLENWDS